LLKTWNPSLTIWTYCVAPTSPFVSGGAQLQATPGNGIPLKFRPGAGMFGSDGCDWTTVSRTSLCSETARGFGLASISRPGAGGLARISRSGREVSLWYEWPTIACFPAAPAVAASGARGSGPFTLTLIRPPDAPASTTPAPTDSAATANMPTTTRARRALAARLHC
jgi:hypothetical protein